MNQNAIETLLRILRRADRLATVAMHGDVPDYEMSEELSGVCGELIALIEDNCLSDDEPTPELLAVAQAVTRADHAVMLEQAGANPDAPINNQGESK